MGGISTNTPTRTLFGTDGYVTVDTVDLGATLGDIEVSWSAEQYYPDYAQARGPISGSGKVTGGTMSISVTVAEFAWTNLTEVMGSVGSDSSGDSYKFGGAALTNVTEVDNVIVTGITTLGSKEFRATIGKAYVEVGNLTLAEASETGLQLTFHGVYTTAAPTTLPGYIEIEK